MTMQVDKVMYTAEAKANAGRNGTASSSDGVLDLKLAMPAEMGGPGGEATNPEQLFAAGYAACFNNALIRVAGMKDVPADDATVTAKIGIGRMSGGTFGLTAALEVSMPGVDRETAQALVERAHEVCPYSNAVRGNIDVQLTVV